MSNDGVNAGRRRFLVAATSVVGAAGAVGAAVPFVGAWLPSARAKAAGAPVKVNISKIQPGEQMVADWRGKPVFIRNRTPEEVEAAKAVPLAELKDPVARNANLPADAQATDGDRAVAGKENWLVMVGVCTPPGCVPLGQQGDFGGWCCPCHGSHYDTSGRIRQGPAPKNLAIPKYEYSSPSMIKISL